MTAPQSPASCSRFNQRSGSPVPRRRLAALSKAVAEEPFRLFFILGILASIVAAAQWPLFFLHWSEHYPGLTHPRLMIEGFLGAFVIGFLGTAGPRMVSAPRFTRLEVAVLAVLFLMMSSFHTAGQFLRGDQLFLALLMTFGGCLLARFVFLRKESPPVPFVLAASGLLCAASGVWLLLENPMHPLGRLLLYQGFLLLPCVGIGSFLFPRLLGTEDQRRPLPLAAAISLAVLCAASIVASFFLEARGAVTGATADVQLARLIRTGAAAVYLILTVPWRRRESAPSGTLSKVLLWSCAFGLAGLISAGFADAAHYVPLDHLLYIGGFGLLALTVASRVLLGHSGQVHLFHQKSKAVRWWASLIIVGVFTRVSANFFQKITVSHYIYAAVLWIVAAIIWIVWQRSRFLCREEE